jgi:hypothetical protein
MRTASNERPVARFGPWKDALVDFDPWMFLCVPLGEDESNFDWGLWESAVHTQVGRGEFTIDASSLVENLRLSKARPVQAKYPNILNKNKIQLISAIHLPGTFNAAMN